MKAPSSFLDLDLQQKVSPFLALLLIASILSWLVVYYLFNYADSIVSKYSTLIDGSPQAVDSGGTSH